MSCICVSVSCLARLSLWTAGSLSVLADSTSPPGECERAHARTHAHTPSPRRSHWPLFIVMALRWRQETLALKSFLTLNRSPVCCNEHCAQTQPPFCRGTQRLVTNVTVRPRLCRRLAEVAMEAYESTCAASELSWLHEEAGISDRPPLQRPWCPPRFPPQVLIGRSEQRERDTYSLLPQRRGLGNGRPSTNISFHRSEG